VEELLVRLWSDVLGVSQIGVEDNFFELGGHSLLATQLISRIRGAFAVELAVAALFECPTVAGLAGRVGAALRGGGQRPIPPLRRMERGELIPLSFAQQRLWFLDQLVPGNAFYNIPMALRLEGRLDVGGLERAVSEIVKRHEALRTRFVTIEGYPRQAIEQDVAFGLEIKDLRGLEEAERETIVREVAEEEARRPFDLTKTPLLRGKVLQLGEEEQVLLLTMHHIVSDGWSMGVLTREMSELYNAFVEGRQASLPELAVQYADFAVWQREWLQGEVLEEHLKYWRERLQGVATLELPTDYPRPAMLSYRGGWVSRSVPAEVTEKLRQLSQEEGATLFMTLLAAYQVLLGRYSGQTD